MSRSIAQGEIGLITTGAGLSMQLIDELKSQGRRPLNFCDIRSGQFRGDPARLIAVMRWIASRPSVRVVLVNIFAGITDSRRIRPAAGAGGGRRCRSCACRSSRG